MTKAYLQAWRAKNKGYGANFMKEKRAFYKKLYKLGMITYKHIPKSYRSFKVDNRGRIR